MENAEKPNKCSEDKTQKAIWKKWWFWAVIVVILWAVGSSSEDTTQQPESVVENEQESEPTQETEKEEIKPTQTTESEQEISLEDKFVEDVKSEIAGAVGEGEIIVDVILKDDDLCVYVDLSSTVQQLPIPLEDLAIARTCSITDEILELVQYKELWKTITIDFGELGYIQNGKDNIKNDGYGEYFSSENFKLETR